MQTILGTEMVTNKHEAENKLRICNANGIGQTKAQKEQFLYCTSDFLGSNLVSLDWRKFRVWAMTIHKKERQNPISFCVLQPQKQNIGDMQKWKK